MVRNKSLLNAQREVVSCHAFDHQGLHDYQNRHSLVDGSLTSIDLTEQPWNGEEHRSYYVAQAVEAKLSLDCSGKTNPFQATPQARYFAVEPHTTHINADEDRFESLKGKGNFTSLKRKSSQEQLYLTNYKPITYSELFPTRSSNPISYFHETGNNLVFHSAFKSFCSELAVTNPVQDWDFETHSEGNLNEHSQSSANTVISLNTLNIASGARSSLKTIKSPLHKEKFQRHSHHYLMESSNQNQRDDALFFPKVMEPESPLMLKSAPNVFVHDPIDALDDTIQDSKEHGFKQSTRKSKKRKSAILTVEDQGNSCITKEMREMLDRSFVEACCFTNHVSQT